MTNQDNPILENLPYRDTSPWINGIAVAVVFFLIGSFGIYLLAGWKWSLVYDFIAVGLIFLVMAAAEYLFDRIKQELLK